MKQTFNLVLFLLSALLAAGLTACSPGQPLATPSVPPTAEPVKTNPPKEWMLTYNRSGGLAGVNETWKILADGQVLDDQGQAILTDKDKLSALMANINQADFSKFSDDYGKGSRCNDCFSIKLSFEQEGVTKTILMVEDGSAEIPKELQTIVQGIAAIVPAY